MTNRIEAIATERIERLGKGPDDLKAFAELLLELFHDVELPDAVRAELKARYPEPLEGKS